VYRYIYVDVLENADGTEMVQVTLFRELWHLLPKLNALVAVSKGMRAVKLCSSKILQFLGNHL